MKARGQGGRTTTLKLLLYLPELFVWKNGGREGSQGSGPIQAITPPARQRATRTPHSSVVRTHSSSCLLWSSLPPVSQLQRDYDLDGILFFFFHFPFPLLLLCLYFFIILFSLLPSFEFDTLKQELFYP